MKMTDRDRRDWSLVVFIVPIGILLMLIAAWMAMWAMPQWRLQAGMRSNLEVNGGGQSSDFRPLINPLILTPISWLGTYLTPSGANPFFVPIVVIQPSATASPPILPTSTETPSAPVTASPSATVVGTASVTGTSKLPADDGGTPTPPTSPTTCQDPAATNNGGSLPCTYPPTTCQDPAATNNGGSLPCTYLPTTCQDPAATNNGGPLPCTYPPTGFPSTPDPSWIMVAPPAAIGIGTQPNNTIGNLTNGTYVVIGLSVVVGATPDNNYDLAIYEFNNGGSVLLDWMIVGISNDSSGAEYFEVFNWGDGVADDNSNVGDVAGTEVDNQVIALTELHDPDGGGSAPQTGILIDVDQATSDPPPNTYNFLLIISPSGGSGDVTQIDSVQATEIPIPP